MYVYVCMCMYICVYVYVCMYICVYVFMYVCMYVCVGMYVFFNTIYLQHDPLHLVILHAW